MNWSAIGGPKGLPVVGDFNGDGFTDLAVWSNGKFYVSFGANAYSEIDAIVPLSFSGTNARPVAADIDGARTATGSDPIWACGCPPAARLRPPRRPIGTSCLRAGRRSARRTSFTPV